MPRLTDLNLCGLDITWFAVDRYGVIATFFSGGNAQVGAYFVEDSMRISKLETHFRSFTRTLQNEILLAPDVRVQLGYSEQRPLPDYSDAIQFAKKGLHVFDFFRVGRVWDGYFRLYSCTCPLTLAEVDEEIAEMLRNVRIESSFVDATRIPGALIL